LEWVKVTGLNSRGFGSESVLLKPAQDFVAAPGMARAQLNIPRRRVPASRTHPSVVPEIPECEVLTGEHNRSVVAKE